MSSKKRPVVIELENDSPIEPENAPVVPDVADLPTGRAMQSVAAFAARPPSRLLRWFWRLGFALLAFGLSVWTWDTITALILRNTYLGYAALGLAVAFLLVCGGIVLREVASYTRMRRLDKVHDAAARAIADNNLDSANRVVDQVLGLYRGRDDMAWGRDRLQDRRGDLMDADALFDLTEAELLAPLDTVATKEVEAAARTVATVTAIVPLALADVFTALAANMRMVRRIAEIYGGRAGAFGSWRLLRTVLTHLVATGAVAVGDDLISSVAGGGVLSKFSRRFGEGVINGSLTARVGVAAIEVCRPLPFRATKRPTVTGIVKRALAGLFGAS